MPIYLPELSFSNYDFPDVASAKTEPDGLLAFGGDLATERLCAAYDNGIFPWFSEGEPYLWWSPKARCIIELEDFHLGKTFRKWFKKQTYTMTVNHAFDRVIEACAFIPRANIKHTDGTESENGVWITQEMISAYKKLHSVGRAHSIEVWDKEILVAGLYGVSAHGIFCGESMFHTQPNTSKLAFAGLVKFCRQLNLAFIDGQIANPYLTSLGAITIPRETFIHRLQHSKAHCADILQWQPQTLCIDLEDICTI
ncbi:leucyl/phenylalanyl-tRNA--protein transferase [Opacimonas viscosa]|uniref:Leucyl/phenylalanyl-tRNA--protein transferase n=1 Tax=Opacimonas viscosa TaxID=2961944 RepID=A0AA41X1E3_9ALTE|nr:leucyl/phenylalanyl-tRNA--protein transferase [Opacimonas viscosa]MCP3428596.1 leucyl/phenylalanyl-tRNA--protein transferase [Opacimonas viscosa]